MTERTDETRDYAIGPAGGRFEAARRTNHAGRAKTKITRSRAVCVRGHCGDGPRIQSRHTFRHHLLADASASYPTPTLRSTRGCSCCCLYYLHIAPLSTTTTRSPTVFFYAPPGNSGLRLGVVGESVQQPCAVAYTPESSYMLGTRSGVLLFDDRADG